MGALDVGQLVELLAGALEVVRAARLRLIHQPPPRGCRWRGRLRCIEAPLAERAAPRSTCASRACTARSMALGQGRGVAEVRAVFWISSRPVIRDVQLVGSAHDPTLAHKDRHAVYPPEPQAPNRPMGRNYSGNRSENDAPPTLWDLNVA
ncbi:hypothetical protein FB451DRAFT_1178778 [Mycena latifolia]|nr:hypothetical protein FB451DRAFT_1178778 [Mycena latifolia]